jgi:hypothetical protein
VPIAARKWINLDWCVSRSLFVPKCARTLIWFRIAGVAGGASSGKSTVCKMIIDQLRDQRVVVVTQVCILQSGFCLWSQFPSYGTYTTTSYVIIKCKRCH